MSNRRNFLKGLSLLTVGSLAGSRMTAATVTDEITKVNRIASGKKRIGLQTYSLGQELLQDLPNGLNRLANMGYTDLEIFGYRDDSGKFGDYSPTNTIFIAPKDYKKMADDAGLVIASSHLTPMRWEYTAENIDKFDDFWKKATDVHAELGVSYMVQPSMPNIQNEDDAKQVAEIFNRAGEITKKAGIDWGYHNHSNEFKRVLKAGEQPEQNPNPWAPPKGTYIEELLLENTDPDKVNYELDVYWAVMGQQDPVEWIEKYPGRFKLLHIKDRWIIGDSGMMNFPNIFDAAYNNGVEAYFVELEGDKKGRSQFEGVEKSADYLKNASFVK